MKIAYLGQSCFVLTTEKGVRILTDPYSSGIGYRMPKVSADIVTISHDHFDHNNLGAVTGQYDLFRREGSFESHGVRIRGIHTYHDDVSGRKRGSNIVFCFEADGLRICHAGDLGHVPDPEQLSAIGRPDILMVPVGEVFTFRVEDAAETIGRIRPAVAIPMHYKVKTLTIGLEKVDKFLKLFSHYRTARGSVTVTRDMLRREPADGPAKILVIEPQ